MRDSKSSVCSNSQLTVRMSFSFLHVQLNVTTYDHQGFHLSKSLQIIIYDTILQKTMILLESYTLLSWITKTQISVVVIQVKEIINYLAVKHLYS